MCVAYPLPYLQATSRVFACCPATAAADALSSSSSEFGSSAKDAASGLKAKAKSVIKGATSAVPNTTATLGDLNADMRSDAYTYRDPAIATPQDKATGAPSLVFGSIRCGTPASALRGWTVLQHGAGWPPAAS
jgi:hypothetical protein